MVIQSSFQDILCCFPDTIASMSLILSLAQIQGIHLMDIWPRWYSFVNSARDLYKKKAPIKGFSWDLCIALEL